ncbi:MAG: PQQ-like beta-propeller repeat protein, partial [Prolixibacteraceae bacterium]|nr:PQQ-like beta-propeller repeat protein [Prolixibacteraceae bacterium]
MKKNLFITAIFLISISCVKQSNWNQYLGPNRNAIATDAKISKTWPADGPIGLWSFPLGLGYGGASIFDNEVFVLDRKIGESDILRCIDLNSGEEKWNFTYEADGELPYPGSRAVPTVDENYVWSVGPHGDFYCVNKKTHEPVWHHNLLKEFESELPNWGVSQSPIIYNDLVIVAPQGEKAGVAAFNKITGELVWKSRPLTGYHFHVSPTLANFGETDQIIMISSYDKNDSTKTDEVVAFEANTGDELWTYDGLYSYASISPAMAIDDKRLFLTECAYNDNYDP